MDRLGVLVAAASLFAFALLAWHIPPFAAAAGLVWLSVLLALVASGHRNAMAVAAGALAALAAGLVTPGSPALFGALILLGALAERTTRVRGLKARLFALGLALGAGAVAASVVAAYAGSGAATATVAVLVAGVLATLPLLVPADDPLAHRLTELAALAPEPSRALLTEASHLRRAWNDVGAPRETALRIQPT